MKKNYLLWLFMAFLPTFLYAQKWNELSKTPQMGWSSWNKFQGNINEEIIVGIADALVSSGLRDAGYTYLNIDDCWHGERDMNGFIPNRSLEIFRAKSQIIAGCSIVIASIY